MKGCWEVRGYLTEEGGGGFICSHHVVGGCCEKDEVRGEEGEVGCAVAH